MADLGPASLWQQPVGKRVLAVRQDPNKAWDILKVKTTVQPVDKLDPSTPQREGYTRFVCISDTHGRTEDLVVPDGDVLIHAGDFTNVGEPSQVIKFSKFLGSLPHRHKIVIAGNHDNTFDVAHWEALKKRFGIHSKELKDTKSPTDTRSLLKNCIYLEDEETRVMGFRLYGSPWQPEFCNWAFNLPRGDPCLEKWKMIPDGVDILITHGPPIGHGDKCSSGQRAGCVDLLREVQERVRPKYHIFGHVHEGYGVTTDGQTTFINASTCDLQYKPVNLPIVFELPNPKS